MLLHFQAEGALSTADLTSGLRMFTECLDDIRSVHWVRMCGHGYEYGYVWVGVRAWAWVWSCVGGLRCGYA